MRLKVIYDPRGLNTSVVNAETGELLDGVIHVSNLMPAHDRPRLTIELLDYEFEVYTEKPEVDSNAEKD